LLSCPAEAQTQEPFQIEVRARHDQHIHLLSQLFDQSLGIDLEIIFDQRDCARPLVA
jgi:hypothetical protein